MSEAKCSYPSIFATFRNNWAQVDPFLLELFSKRFPTENKAVFNYATSTHPSTLLITNKIIKKSRERVNNFQSQ
jgi:hypothetical protein